MKILFTILMFVFPFLAFGQAIVGNVINTDREPLKNATVTALDRKIGTITDNKGDFQINLPGDSEKLIISATGYETQTVTAKAGKRIQVILIRRVNTLDEVQVIAY